VKRYLVTGGAGFLGCHLVERLLNENHEVAVYDNLSFGRMENIESVMDRIKFVKGDLTNPHLLEETVKSFAPEVVIHLAAIHFIPYCNAHPAEAVSVNIDGTHNLLDACSRYKPEKILFASSAAVYPPSDYPHREDDEIMPFDIYGTTKICGEMLMQLFSHQTSVSTASCRFFNIYGPKETNDHVVPHIINQLKDGQSSIRLGNMHPKRDYIYTDDMVDALCMLTDIDIRQHEVFNIGTSLEYSVDELISKMRLILKKNIAIESATEFQRKVDRPHLVSDNSRIKARTGWYPKFDIDKGLTELINYELGPAFSK
jgi:UDP-glucose 4-epimerase